MNLNEETGNIIVEFSERFVCTMISIKYYSLLMLVVVVVLNISSACGKELEKEFTVMKFVIIKILLSNIHASSCNDTSVIYNSEKSADLK